MFFRDVFDTSGIVFVPLQYAKVNISVTCLIANKVCVCLHFSHFSIILSYYNFVSFICLFSKLIINCHTIFPLFSMA